MLCGTSICSTARRWVGWNWVIASIGALLCGARRDDQVREERARELGGEVVVGPGEGAEAQLAEQDRVLERAEHHRERERSRALRVGVLDLGMVREQKRGQSRADVLREALAPRLELLIHAHPHRERAQEAALLAVDLDQEAHDRRADLADARALPARRVERRIGGGDRLDEEALVQRSEQCVLVREARVEGADRGTRAPRDLRDRRVVEALLRNQRLRRVEDAIERLLAAGLLRRSDPLEHRNTRVFRYKNHNSGS